MIHELYVLPTNFTVKFDCIEPRTGWDRDVGFMDYGDYWRIHRKYIHQHFRLQVIQDYHPKIVQRVHAFLVSLVDSPTAFLKHYRL